MGLACPRWCVHVCVARRVQWVELQRCAAELPMARLGRFAVAHVFISLCAGQLGMGPEDLQPLTEFRQQHRKTIDGRLCAAAFVQDRKAYTGCALARNPVGESGRPWCYVEPQV